MGFAGVDADVAAPGRLPPKRLGQRPRVREGLTENQSAPTQLDLDVLRHRIYQMRWSRVVEAEGDRLGVVLGRTDDGHAAGPVTP